MKKVLAIASKELASQFRSPIAYIVLMATMIVFNIFFYLIIEDNNEAALKDLFKIMEFMFVFLVPLITMKSFAEEKYNGTLEFLMTTPTSNTAIVWGKYLGTLALFTIIIVLSFVYYILIEIFADPDRWAILSGYLGIWLEGAFFVAIGVMCSAWTKNQILAAINAYLIILLLFFSFVFIKYFSGTTAEIIRYVSTIPHMENFAVGLITIEDIVYYLSGIIFCITVTRISIENRWGR